VLAPCRVAVGLRNVFLWRGSAERGQDCSAVEADVRVFFFAFERLDA